MGPTVAILDVPTSTYQVFNVRVEFSEAVSGFELTEISVVNGTPLSFTALNETLYEVQIVPGFTGDMSLSINKDVAEDKAGNENSASVITTVALITDTDGDGLSTR